MKYGSSQKYIGEAYAGVGASSRNSAPLSLQHRLQDSRARLQNQMDCLKWWKTTPRVLVQSVKYTPKIFTGRNDAKWKRMGHGQTLTDIIQF